MFSALPSVGNGILIPEQGLITIFLGRVKVRRRKRRNEERFVPLLKILDGRMVTAVRLKVNRTEEQQPTSNPLMMGWRGERKNQLWMRIFYNHNRRSLSGKVTILTKLKER